MTTTFRTLLLILTALSVLWDFRVFTQIYVLQSGGGFKITAINLTTEADVPGIDEAKFKEQADLTKKNCPVSIALSGTQINLIAKLVSG